MDKRKVARDRIWVEVVAAGGAEVVALEIGVHWTRLYVWRRVAGELRADKIRALRAMFPRVPASVWGDALAPV